MKTIASLAVAVSLLATPVLATGEIESLITDADRERLAGYEATRAGALAEAFRSGTPEDVDTLNAMLPKDELSFADVDLTGDWQCRTAKAGGLAGLVIYGWFKCRITDDGSGWRLQKLTGSQKTTGRFFTDSDTRLTYLGSFSVNDDAPLPYGSGPESDQVGYAFRSSQDTFRIEFPAPFYESKLDILELRR